MSEVSLREYMEAKMRAHEALHVRDDQLSVVTERDHERRHRRHEEDIKGIQGSQSRMGGMWTAGAAILALFAGLASGIVSGIVVAMTR